MIAFIPLASLAKGRWRGKSAATVGFRFIELPFFTLSSNPLYPPLSKGGQVAEKLPLQKGNKMWGRPFCKRDKIWGYPFRKGNKVALLTMEIRREQSPFKSNSAAVFCKT